METSGIVEATLDPVIIRLGGNNSDENEQSDSDDDAECKRDTATMHTQITDIGPPVQIKMFMQ